MADQQVNDDVLDRALREALDVAPSADFVARVRTRIAGEPAPHGVFSGWLTWKPITACATAAAIALAVWIGRPAPQVRRQAPERVAVVATPTPTKTPTETPTVRLKPDPTETPIVPVGAGFSRPVIASHKEPEILISASESAALRRLIARASEGQIAAEFPTPATEPDMEVLPLPEIKPLKIELVVPVNGEEGVRQ